MLCGANKGSGGIENNGLDNASLLAKIVTYTCALSVSVFWALERFSSMYLLGLRWTIDDDDDDDYDNDENFA